MPQGFITIGLIITIFLIAFTIKLLLTTTQERFADIREIGTRYICPTRNQNFDIRGDIPIPRNDWAVYNSSIGSRQPELCKYNRLE